MVTRDREGVGRAGGINGADSTRGKRRASVTSHDVARAAGVSQATVSRVLRHDANVSQDMRDRVMRALAETGYELNASARAFRTNQTGSIGVVVARLSNQIYPAMLESLGARLASLGQRMIVWDAEYGGDVQASQALRQGVVDGVILAASTSESEFIKEVNSPDAPVVLINRTVEGYPSDQVFSDNAGGGRRVAEYFVRCGRERIALIGGPQQASTIRERERSFREALVSAGIELLPHYYQRSLAFSHASGKDAALRLLELAVPPDAVFCVNDVLALGAIDGARVAGVRVPEDVWIVGYDDIELASWDAYELTTVRQPMTEMVAYAIDMLLAKIRNPEKPIELKCLANELVIRKSTGKTPFPYGGA
jgi:LacI family transcriptional regulator